MDIKKLKKDTIQDMLEQLGGLHKTMSNSDLKKDYSRFLYFIQSNLADLQKVLEYCQKRILLYKTANDRIDDRVQEYNVMFWTRVKDIVINAYLKNKQLDRSA